MYRTGHDDEHVMHFIQLEDISVWVGDATEPCRPHMVVAAGLHKLGIPHVTNQCDPCDQIMRPM